MKEMLRKWIADYQHYMATIGSWESKKTIEPGSLERGTTTGDPCQAGGTLFVGKPLTKEQVYDSTQTAITTDSCVVEGCYIRLGCSSSNPNLLA